MFSFHPLGYGKLFEYLISNTASVGDGDVDTGIKIIYPENSDLEPKKFNFLKSYMFPLVQNEFQKWGTITYVNIFRNEIFPDLPQFLYIYIHYEVVDQEITITGLISQYFHYRLLTWIVEKAASTTDIGSFLDSFRDLAFKQMNYGVEIFPPEEYGCPFCTNLSASGEINYLRQHFLSYYPPFMIGTLISLLFRDSRIIVISSSFDFLSLTVFSILSLVYPLEISREVRSDSKIPSAGIPLLTLQNVDQISSKPPTVIGLHSSMMGQLVSNHSLSEGFVVFNADEPYISNQSMKINNDNLVPLMTKLNNEIRAYILHLQPVFPASYIDQEIRLFIVKMISIILKSKSCGFNDIIETWNNLKSKLKKDDSPEYIVANSVLMAKLMNNSNIPGSDIFPLYWEIDENPKSSSLKFGNKPASELFKTVTEDKIIINSAQKKPLIHLPRKQEK